MITFKIIICYLGDSFDYFQRLFIDNYNGECEY